MPCLPTKWCSYRDNRFCDFTSSYVYTPQKTFRRRKHAALARKGALGAVGASREDEIFAEGPRDATNHD